MVPGRSKARSRHLPKLSRGWEKQGKTTRSTCDDYSCGSAPPNPACRKVPPVVNDSSETNGRPSHPHRLLVNPAVSLQGLVEAYGKCSPAKPQSFWGSHCRFRCLWLSEGPDLSSGLVVGVSCGDFACSQRRYRGVGALQWSQGLGGQERPSPRAWARAGWA